MNKSAQQPLLIFLSVCLQESSENIFMDLRGKQNETDI